MQPPLEREISYTRTLGHTRTHIFMKTHQMMKTVAFLTSNVISDVRIFVFRDEFSLIYRKIPSIRPGSYFHSP